MKKGIIDKKIELSLSPKYVTNWKLIEEQQIDIRGLKEILRDEQFNL